ncbi:LppM family (lipo)protein [Amycolatopsis sp. H20-H5]|uniref:LppM family (lipo)protein n=1 Tax=Amycolatopsis sp. H20-H5 TaxID=3046309 RepID=UPI002DB819D8|nr:hypothetical protein [Amycolatopsis sp. H20-H5]MEC3981611.1 hypothetical protein [Amycolatopsis sp. H20-H5]
MSRSWRRAVSGLLAAGLLALSLSGCLRYRFEAVIGDSGAVSGKLVYGWGPELVGFLAHTSPGHDPVGDLIGYLTGNARSVKQGHAEVRRYSADRFEGAELDFSGVAATDFGRVLQGDRDRNLPEARFSLELAGDKYVFSARETTPGNGRPPAGPGVSTSVEIGFALTFPGKVVEADGRVDGRTVTWEPKLGTPLSLHATGMARPASPAGVHSGQRTGGGTSTVVALVLGGAVLLLGALGLLLLVLRARHPLKGSVTRGRWQKKGKSTGSSAASEA